MSEPQNALESPGLAGMLVVAASIAVILLIPPIWSVYKLGTQAIFNFFKQDTFYYLAIANNSWTGFYTFDGELPTSGFHPLWQVLLTGLFKWGRGLGSEWQIHTVFSLSVALTSLGYVLAGLSVYRVTQSKLLGLLIVPGFFYLAFSFVTRFENSPWSYMNGMESSLSVFFGGTLLYLVAMCCSNGGARYRNTKFFLVVGIVLALVFMSRLDDVFLVGSFVLCTLLSDSRGPRERLTAALVLGLPSLLFLVCYLTFNRYMVGTFLPVSGIAKSGLVALDNTRQLIGLSGLVPFPLSLNAYLQFFEIYYRHVQMIFPMLLSVLFILVVRKGSMGLQLSADQTLYVTALLVYVIMKAVYNFVNVHVNHQGLSWYYPLSIMSINFMALVLVSPAYSRYAPRDVSVRVWSTIVLALFLAVLTIMMTANMLNIRSHGSRVFAFWKKGERIAAHLSSVSPGSKLIEYDDGFITYSLGIPATHGIGFALDPEGFAAKKQGRFLERGFRRGFDTIASLQYLPVRRADLSSDQIAALLRQSRFFGKEDLSRYHFEVILIDKGTGAAFIKFRPKGKDLKREE